MNEQKRKTLSFNQEEYTTLIKLKECLEENSVKEAVLQIADDWIRLAEQADKFYEEHPELDGRQKYASKD